MEGSLSATSGSAVTHSEQSWSRVGTHLHLRVWIETGRCEGASVPERAAGRYRAAWVILPSSSKVSRTLSRSVWPSS